MLPLQVVMAALAEPTIAAMIEFPTLIVVDASFQADSGVVG